ncbi:MAG: hypothetical protein ACR2M3_09515 [Thermomicrobiales bacterium]
MSGFAHIVTQRQGATALKRGLSHIILDLPQRRYCWRSQKTAGNTSAGWSNRGSFATSVRFSDVFASSINDGEANWAPQQAGQGKSHVVHQKGRANREHPLFLLEFPARLDSSSPEKDPASSESK